MPNEEVYVVDENGYASDRASSASSSSARHVMKGIGASGRDQQSLEAWPLPGEMVLYTATSSAQTKKDICILSAQDDIIKTRAKKSSPREVEKSCTPSRAWPKPQLWRAS